MSMAKFSIEKPTSAKDPKTPKPAKPVKASGSLWIDVGLGKIMAKQTPN